MTTKTHIYFSPSVDGKTARIAFYWQREGMPELKLPQYQRQYTRKGLPREIRIISALMRAGHVFRGWTLKDGIAYQGKRTEPEIPEAMVTADGVGISLDHKTMTKLKDTPASKLPVVMTVEAVKSNVDAFMPELSGPAGPLHASQPEGNEPQIVLHRRRH